MLVEIPDPEVIFGIIASFLVGIFGLYLYYKIKPFIKFKPGVGDSSYFERLEYYERQLIDMKIRLDAIDLDDLEHKSLSVMPEKGVSEKLIHENKINREKTLEKFHEWIKLWIICPLALYRNLLKKSQ